MWCLEMRMIKICSALAVILQVVFLFVFSARILRVRDSSLPHSQDNGISGSSSSLIAMLESSTPRGIVLATVMNSKIGVSDQQMNIGSPLHVTFLPDPPVDRQAIDSYLHSYRAVCETNATTNQCPCVPPSLRGRMLVNVTTVQSYTWAEVTAVSGALLAGGVWRPADCTPVRTLLVLIPYRDRESHLRSFLSHMHPILQRQKVAYRILVVEQRRPAVFNKASVMNAGFREATRREWQFDCLVLHDVDLLPEDDRNFLSCGRKVIHYCRFISKHDYKHDAGLLFGGVVAMTPGQFRLINGYSNRFFGWGGEDDNAFKRVRKSGLKIARLPEAVGNYTSLRHVRDTGNPKVFRPRGSLWNATLEEGLSTVMYDVVSVSYLPLYTHILIDLNDPLYPFKRDTTVYFPEQPTTDCPHIETIKVVEMTKHKDLLDLCKDECAMDVKCSAFVTDSTNASSCRLKQSGCINKLQLSSESHVFLKGIDLRLGNLSGIYDVHERDCLGHDMSQGQVKNVFECAMSCHKLKECRGFVINIRNICYMKTVCRPRLSDTTVLSYAKISNS